MKRTTPAERGKAPLGRRARILAYCDEEIATLKRELFRLYEARAIFAREPAAEQPAPVQTIARRKAPKRAATSRTPKKSATKRRHRTSDDATVVRKGKLPKVGVQQLVCDTLAARQAKVKQLKADGYQRISSGQRLTAGTFDVRPSGDEGESVVVLWRAMEVAGE